MRMRERGIKLHLMSCDPVLLGLLLRKACSKLPVQNHLKPPAQEV